MRLKYFGSWLITIVLFSCGTTNVYQLVKLETKMAAQHVVFNPLNTPISYYYFITLLDTHGNVYYVKTNNYYLSELYGISESAFVKRDYLKKCGNIVYKANGEPEMENIFLRYDENSFYFKNKSTVSQKVN